jgi:ADP-ribose pyrophosphatase YjhB (NUDIX family)
MIVMRGGSAAVASSGTGLQAVARAESALAAFVVVCAQSMSDRVHRTRISAYGLILQDAQILLCRLSSTFPKHPGHWTLPGGGLEFGEDPAVAVVREVYEETGLTVQPGAVASIDSLLVDEAERAFHGLRIIYYTTVTGGTLRYERDGSTDLCAWWTYDEAKRLPLVDLVQVGLQLAFGSERG